MLELSLDNDLDHDLYWTWLGQGVENKAVMYNLASGRWEHGCHVKSGIKGIQMHTFHLMKSITNDPFKDTDWFYSLMNIWGKILTFSCFPLINWVPNAHLTALLAVWPKHWNFNTMVCIFIRDVYLLFFYDTIPILTKRYWYDTIPTSLKNDAKQFIPISKVFH